MSEISVATKRTLAKRLSPLYVAVFLQSFVLWYTIEKLFMRSIGFNNTTIGLMVALYSVVMLVVETPSGILADRWSRKGVLMIAGFCLGLSALAGGMSHGIFTYMICAVLWGVFFACYSGMYDTIVYDTLAEVSPGENQYEHYYGRVQFFDGIGLVLSSLIGAFIAAQTSLRFVYFLTIPFALLSVIALAKFKEPKLHKQHAVIPLPEQLKDTVKAVTLSRNLLPVVIVLIIRSALIFSIYEFSQLWLIALNMPTGYFGLANAALLSSIGIGGILVSRLKLSRYIRILSTLALLLVGSLGLILSRNTIVVVTSQFTVATTLIFIYIIFSRILHDNLPASIRAGAASATSTLGRFVVIPIALLFGYVSQHYSIYKAGYILLCLAVLVAVFTIAVANRNNRTGLEPN